MKYIRTSVRNSKGFTLVETLVSVGIFTVIMGLVATVMFNTFSHDHKTRVSRMLYEETRVALERMVKEVRKGTIDYEEYYSWYRCTTATCDMLPDATADSSYGKNYGYYALQFYRDASAGVTQAPPSPDQLSRADENVGKNINNMQPALGDGQTHARCDDAASPSYPGTTDGYEQCELYLISMDGSEKTIFRVQQDGAEYRLAMLKLHGYDYGVDHAVAVDPVDPTDHDGQIDTWLAEDDFTGYDFRLIQPNTIKITNIKFFVSPLEDPRKNFACFEASASDCLNKEVQIQPHITIIMTAEPSLSQMAGIQGTTPSVTLQTTVTARAQNEVTSVK